MNDFDAPRSHDVVVVYCTCPDMGTARQIARRVVHDKRVACVNILPGISSVYEWQDEVCEDAEVLLLLKTTRAGFTALQDAIVAEHPYELPEIIAVPVSDGLPGYMEWVANTVKDS